MSERDRFEQGGLSRDLTPELVQAAFKLIDEDAIIEE